MSRGEIDGNVGGRRRSERECLSGSRRAADRNLPQTAVRAPCACDVASLRFAAHTACARCGAITWTSRLWLSVKVVSEYSVMVPTSDSRVMSGTLSACLSGMPECACSPRSSDASELIITWRLAATHPLTPSPSRSAVPFNWPAAGPACMTHREISASLVYHVPANRRGRREVAHEAGRQRQHVAHRRITRREPREADEREDVVGDSLGRDDHRDRRRCGARDRAR